MPVLSPSYPALGKPVFTLIQVKVFMFSFLKLVGIIHITFQEPLNFN